MKLRGALFCTLATVGLCVLSARAEVTLEQLVEDRKLWPSRIATNKPLTVQVIDANLEPKGFRDLKKGELVPLAAVSGSTLDVRVPGGTAVLFTEDTDLLERAAYKKKHGREKAVPKPKPKPKPTSSYAAGKLTERLQNRLTHSDGGKKFLPFKLEQKKKTQYYLFYHSAKWCPPCRAFTPKLARLYNLDFRARPDVEFIFISADKSAGGMRDYMQSYHMPWPAIRYQDRQLFNDVRQRCGCGIPGLALYDSNGNFIAGGNHHTVLDKLKSL